MAAFTDGCTALPGGTRLATVPASRMSGRSIVAGDSLNQKVEGTLSA